MTERISFKKAYSRDTTLFLQGLWAEGLKTEPLKRFGWNNPHLPLTAHYVNAGVVEIWEHQPAITWMLDMLLEENKKGKDFLEAVFEEYKPLLARLKEVHAKGPLAPQDAGEYRELAYNAAFLMTLFFYAGGDERSPAEAKHLSVEAREAGDFFADNDAFIRRSLVEREHISEEQAGVVLADELLELPSIELLDARLASYLLIDGAEQGTGTLEAFSVLHPEYEFPEEKVAAISQFKGQAAFKGMLQGPVRIVRKKSDMDKVKEGDILVSPMTTPDFLPAMIWAAGFVTDEGGITCHAAIVAREMQKPCVIGTKIATQVLKDGDSVEVDANTGIVKILS